MKFIYFLFPAALLLSALLRNMTSHAPTQASHTVPAFSDNKTVPQPTIDPETIKNTIVSKKTSGSHRMDYESMLSDGVLEIAIAVGFTEEYATIPGRGHLSLHEHNLEIIRKWLASKALSLVSSSDGTERYQGNATLRIPGEVGFWEKNTTIRLKLLLPRPQTATNFVAALSDSEVVVYLGHSRFGIGPDFDHIKSKEGNCVLGLHSALHKNHTLVPASEMAQLKVSTEEVNSFETLGQTSPAPSYRVVFFNACNTFRYLDEWRSALLPAALRSTQTDLLLTNGVINLAAAAQTTTTFLDQMLLGKILESYPATIFNEGSKAIHQYGFYGEEEISGFRSVYFWNGISDNPVVKNPEIVQ